MTLECGKIYKINQFFWLLFPAKEALCSAAGIAAARAVNLTQQFGNSFSPALWVSSLSEQLQLQYTVSFLGEGDILLVVEVSDIQAKVINQEGKSGWINFPATQSWTKGTITEISSDL